MSSRICSLITSSLWTSKPHFYICTTGLHFASSTKPSSRFSRTVWKQGYQHQPACQRHKHYTQALLVVSGPVPPRPIQRPHHTIRYPRLLICSAKCRSNHPFTHRRHIHPSQPQRIHHLFLLQHQHTTQHRQPYTTTFRNLSFSPPWRLFQHRRLSTHHRSPTKVSTSKTNHSSSHRRRHLARSTRPTARTPIRLHLHFDSQHPRCRPVRPTALLQRRRQLSIRNSHPCRS